MILTYKKNGRKYTTKFGLFIGGIKLRILTLCGRPTVQGLYFDSGVDLTGSKNLIFRNNVVMDNDGPSTVIRTKI